MMSLILFLSAFRLSACRISASCPKEKEHLDYGIGLYVWVEVAGSPWILPFGRLRLLSFRRRKGCSNITTFQQIDTAFSPSVVQRGFTSMAV